MPVTALARGSALGFKIGNILFSLLAALAVYCCTRLIAGEKSAAVALVLVGFSRQSRLFSISIPTHDIPGTLYLLGGMTALIAAFGLWRTNQRPIVLVLLVFVAAVLGGLAEVQPASARSCTRASD